jgi:hypothetical protein
MNVDTRGILAILDEHAVEFNFPVLDNAYVEFAAARLTAFRGSEHWLICFEVLGFSLREVEFVTDLYAFGSCTQTQGFIGEEIPITSSPEHPIYDRETNQGIADWCRWSVKLGQETVTFSPTREDYARAGIVIDDDCGPGTLKEIELLRFLVYTIGRERFFMGDQELLDHFANCSRLSKFVQTSHWNHLDVADGEKPSENACLRSLAEALSTGNPSVFNPGRPNTAWQFWVHENEQESEDDGNV